MRPEVIKSEKLSLPVPLSTLHEILVSYCELEFGARGEVSPIFLIQFPGRLIWLRTRWESERDKFASTETVHDMLKSFDGLSYAFAVEAFVASYSAEEVKSGDYQSPSQLATRDEILMIMSHQRDLEDALYTQFLINSRPNTKLNFLGPRVDEERKMSGQMMSLFRSREERNRATDEAMEAGS